MTFRPIGPGVWSTHVIHPAQRVELVVDGDTLINPRTGQRFYPNNGTDGPGLRAAHDRAKMLLQQQDEMLKRLTKGASFLANVVKVDGATTFICGPGGQLMTVDTPKEPNAPGDLVKLSKETLQITETIANPFHLGEVVTVAEVHRDGYCEIKHQGSLRLAISMNGIEAGDRVVLDRSGQVVTKRVGAAAKPAPITGVRWEDIGGQEDAKRELRDAIELPYRHRELFARYGHAPAKGVLLFGRPGNGKTLLAKAVASSLAEMHGQAVAGGFIYVKGPELLDKFVGESEANIRNLFEQARAHKAKHGHPAVIFVDEAEAVLSARGTGSFMGQTVVPQFLAEMDGMGDSGAFVLLATNRPDSLDPAVVRDGRIDRRVRVCRPDKTTAPEIFKIHLRGKPICGQIDDVASAAVERLFSSDLKLFDVAMRLDRIEAFTLGHVVSGAMIAGIVQRATQLAIRREIDGHGPTGITTDDALDSITQAFREQQHIDQRGAVEEFLEEAGEPAQRSAKGHAHANSN